jgi:hypothetical protein
MKKLILVICICVLAASCRTTRYAKHYKANLDQYSRLIGPVKDPQQFGDSIVQTLNYSIGDVQRNMSNSERTDLIGMGIGMVGAIAGKVLPIGKSNQNLIFGISIAGISVGALDLFLSIYEPIYYNKKAIEAIDAWKRSAKDNAALYSLRASLLSLQETWPAYAP